MLFLTMLCCYATGDISLLLEVQNRILENNKRLLTVFLELEVKIDHPSSGDPIKCRKGVLVKEKLCNVLLHFM